MWTVNFNRWDGVEPNRRMSIWSDPQNNDACDRQAVDVLAQPLREVCLDGVGPAAVDLAGRGARGRSNGQTR
jgi:hypothetical protein